MLRRDFARCALEDLEDELHFLLECHAYDRIRIGFTNFYKSSSPQTDNFIRILSCKDKDTITALVRFLKLAYKIRNGQSYEKQLINPSFFSSLYCVGQVIFTYYQSEVFLIQCRCSLTLFNHLIMLISMEL